MRSGRLPSQVGTQVRLEQALVGERPALGVVLDEEVERIEGHGFRDEVDGDDELAHRARKHDARLPVAERILLPVEEVGLGVDPERVRSDPGPRMRGRPQPDGLRRQGHEPVVPVRRPVMDCDLHARRAYAAGDPRRTLTDGAARHVPDPQRVFLGNSHLPAPVSWAADHFLSSTVGGDLHVRRSSRPGTGFRRTVLGGRSDGEGPVWLPSSGTPYAITMTERSGGTARARKRSRHGSPLPLAVVADRSVVGWSGVALRCGSHRRRRAPPGLHRPDAPGFPDLGDGLRWNDIRLSMQCGSHLSMLLGAAVHAEQLQALAGM